MEKFLNAVKTAIKINMKEIFTRQAELSDQEVIWKWWNDPVTRKMMKLQDNVPWEEHIKWFQNILESETKTLFISLTKEDKLGVVRFDLKEKDVYEVSINLNPTYRGKSYGKKILLSSMEVFFKLKTQPLKLFARFKKINIASQNTFLNNNFILSSHLTKSALDAFDEENENYCEFQKG